MGNAGKPFHLFRELGYYRDELIEKSLNGNPGIRCGAVLAAAETPYGRHLWREILLQRGIPPDEPEGQVSPSKESQGPSPERR